MNRHIREKLSDVVKINEQFADDDYSQNSGDDFDDPLMKDFDEKK